MSQKRIERSAKPQPPKAAAAQPSAAYPVTAQDLDGQQERLRKAALEGAATLKSSPVKTPKLATTPATMAAKPLAPVAALWPTTDPGNAPTQRLPSPAPSPQPGNPLSGPRPVRKEPGTQTQTAASPKSVLVSFALSKPGARRVSLCGEFNGWSVEATPMKQKEGGRWETTLALRPGRYQYKFVVDGQWIHDPNAPENAPDGYTALNSVIEVRV